MNGIELTERLIADIEQSLKIRNSVPDVITQIKQTNGDNNNLEDFVGAVNTIAFDGFFENVVALINFPGKLIDFNKADIPNTLTQIIGNKEAVSNNIQQLLGNEELVSVDGSKHIEPLKNLLLERLEDLHKVSGRNLM